MIMPTLSRLLPLKLSLTLLIPLTALFLSIFYNQAFLNAVFKLIDSTQTSEHFKIAVFTALVLLFSLGLSIIASKYIFKPFVILLLLSSAILSYLMDNYGMIIDANMIKNIIETNLHTELFNNELIKHIVLLGIIPSIILCLIDIQYHSFFKEIFIRFFNILLFALLFSTIIFIYYQDFSNINKKNRSLRYLINPSYPLYSLNKYLKQIPDAKPNTLTQIGRDAQQISNWKARGKKSIIVLVIGDSARAENFSLNGYEKNTNPLLSQQSIINFPNTYSCSTMTADALPCLFSDFGQKDYNFIEAQSYENLLDVLTHARITVLWRGNNTDCQGVCARVTTEIMNNTAEYCQNNTCVDEILLKDLQQKFDNLSNDAVIVLQQKGSSAPYYQRYNETFKKFTPDCQTNQITQCTREQLINSYDNSILYTEYFLNEVIILLQKNAEQYNTAMIYISNYGQSLGENNVYLYNLPYKIAPKEQTHVPFMLWLSPEYVSSFNIDTACLTQNSNEHYTHDNLFHSILGMLDIQTLEYDAELDIFNRCRH